MTKIVRERSRLDNVEVKPAHLLDQPLTSRIGEELTREASGHLPDLERMNQPVVNGEKLCGRCYLGDAGEAPERRRIENSVSVSLTWRADVVLAGTRGWLGIKPAFV